MKQPAPPYQSSEQLSRVLVQPQQLLALWARNLYLSEAQCFHCLQPGDHLRRGQSKLLFDLPVSAQIALVPFLLVVRSLVEPTLCPTMRWYHRRGCR